MFAFIKKFLLWILGAILFIALIGILLFFAWWVEIPPLTLILILSGIAAVIAIFFAGRRIKIWLNKRQYIKKMLTSVPVEESIVPTTQKQMLLAFDQGLQKIKKSPQNHGKIQAVYSQPWALMLGNSNPQSLIENLTSSKIPANELTKPLRWHFLHNLTLLELDSSLISIGVQNPQNYEYWEDFFTKIVDERKNEPINALIINISATGLFPKGLQNTPYDMANQLQNLALSQEQELSIRDYALTLRSHIEKIMSVLAASVPLYVLVNNIDALYGMNTLPIRLTHTLKEQVLGRVFEDSLLAKNTLQKTNNGAYYAQKAILSAKSVLEQFIENEAVIGNFPQKNELYASTILSKMEDGLSIFMENLLHTLPHSQNPILRVIAFTCSAENSFTQNIVPSSNSQHLSLAPKSTVPQVHTLTPINFAAPQIVNDLLTNVSESVPMANATQMANPIQNVPLMSAPLSLSPTPSNESSTEENKNHLQNTPVSTTFNHTHSLLQTNTPENSTNLEQKLTAPCFIAELFNSIIPKDRFLYKLNLKIKTNKMWIIPAFSGYYLLLFVFCSILAMSSLHNLQTFEDIDKKASEQYFLPVTQNTSLQALQESFQKIVYLENADDSWLLPYFGINSIVVDLEKRKQDFRKNMQKNAISAVFDEIRTYSKENTIATATASTSASTPYFEMQKLLWMQKAITDRIESGKTKSIRDMPFPQNSGTNNDVWNVVFGELYLAYVDYSSEQSLAALAKQIGTDANLLFSSFGYDLLAEIEYEVNTKMYDAEISIARFWSTIPAGSKHYITVPASYTQKGFDFIQKQFTEILTLTGQTDLDLSNYPTWKQYLEYYARIWTDFAMQADYAWTDITRASTLVTMANIDNVYKNPYIRLFQTMAENLAPLQGTHTEAWIDNTFLMNSLLELSKLVGDSDPNSLLATPALILKTLKNSPEHLRVLQKEILDSHSPSYLIDLVESLSQYFKALEAIKDTIKSSTGSFELAKVQFGGANYGNVDESNFTLAKNALVKSLAFTGDTDMLTDIDTHYNDNAATYLIDGPYRFLAHALTIVAAKELQAHWDASIVPAVAVIPSDQLTTVLFSDQGGLITDFINLEAGAFLQRLSGYYDPQVFDNNYFPFTMDFLTFIQDGQEAVYKQPQDSYTIKINSQTGSMNADAKEHLQYVELSLACQDKNYTLRNSNYPENATFQYAPKTCSSTKLSFSFPSIQFTYDYANFEDFLQDFSYGEKEFSSSDFPSVQAQLDELGIKRITVRMLPENASTVLEVVDNLSPLPARICGVW